MSDGLMIYITIMIVIISLVHVCALYFMCMQCSPVPLSFQTAATVVQEQCEADDDMSMQQRLMLAGASTLDGAAEIVGEENEIAGGECPMRSKQNCRTLLAIGILNIVYTGF